MTPGASQRYACRNICHKSETLTARGTPAIRQVAALPYRLSGDPADPAVRVLLVTSRETKRWVLPKGNLVAGLSPAASAAVEAEEEAGIRGATAAAPIGRYSYRKTRWTGVAVLVEVDVFPIAVDTELDDWKERTERERRWFPQSDAADAVDEPDLNLLIRNFRPGPATQP